MPISDREKYGIQIFISAVTKEFGRFREYLRKVLAGPSRDVKIQEDFTASGTRTLEKLDEYILRCHVVIHLAGLTTGAVPHWGDVVYLMQKYPDLAASGGPLSGVSEVQQRQLSYTEWEAYLAAYHERRLYIAKPSGELSDSQQLHLQRLENAGRFAEITFTDDRDLAIQLLQSDLRETIPDCALAHERRDRFGPHAVESLKNILLNESHELCREQFIYNAFTQLTGTTLIPDGVRDGAELNADLVDLLSEDEKPYKLLMLAEFCQQRAAVLNLKRQVSKLKKWIKLARIETGLPPDAIHGQCSVALSHMKDARNPPRPYLQVIWRNHPADTQGRMRVLIEAALCWGRARDLLPVPPDLAISPDKTVAIVADCVYGAVPYRDLAYERLELTVPSGDLNAQWEYPPGADPNDPLCSFYPWPVVLRLRRQSWERKTRVAPQNPMDPTQIACLSGDREHFLQEAKRRGAFFVTWPGASAPDLAILHQAALCTGFGLWLRTPGSLTSADSMLSELAGMSLAGVPDWYHLRKTQAGKSSPWRHASLLYDLPDTDDRLTLKISEPQQWLQWEQALA